MNIACMILSPGLNYSLITEKIILLRAFLLIFCALSSYKCVSNEFKIDYSHVMPKLENIVTM
jgi:hypothetical protein